MPKTLPLLLLTLLFAAGLLAQPSFDISAFSDTTKYGWMDWRDRADYRDELLNRQTLLDMYELQARPIRGTLAQSLLVPGYGQIICDAVTKGSIILCSELVALGAAYLFYDRSMYYYRKYLNATQIEDITSYYNQAQNPRQYSMLFIGLGFIIWAYNIFDVIQTTDEYNAKVWQDVVEKYGSKKVTYGLDGITVRF